MLGLETALGVSLAHLDMPLADVIAALSWKPAAIAGVADRHGRPIAVGEPANLTIFDPDRRVGGRPGPARQQEPQHAVRRRAAARSRASTRSSTAPPWSSTEPPPMMNDHALDWMNMQIPPPYNHSEIRIVSRCGLAPIGGCVIREGALVLADGSVFEGELIGARAAGRDRRGRVQHGAQRLPGGDHRSELRRPDHHLHHAAHRQLRHERHRLRVARHVLSRHRRPRTRPPPQQPPRRVRASTRCCVSTACRASPASTPVGSPGCCATPAPCPEHSDRSARPTSRAAAHAEPGTDGIDLVEPGDDRQPATPSAALDPDSATRIVAVDYGMKRNIAVNLVALRHRRGRPGLDQRRRHPRSRRPTACS